MNRRAAAIILPVLALFAIAARKPNDAKHENHYKLVDGGMNDVLQVEPTKVEAQQQFVAFDGKFTNKTSDRLIVFKRGEASFILPTGTFQTRAGSGVTALLGDTVLIQAGDTRAIGLKVTGDSGFHVDAFSLEPKGFSIADGPGKPLPAPEFQLKPTRNDFEAGPFTCNLNGNKQTTDYTQADFECTYNGTGVGFIDARKIGARSQSGKEYANVAKKQKVDVVLPGEKARFPVWIEIPASDGDMQFVAFNVLFRDAFSEAALAPLDLGQWKFEVDAEKTAAENK